MRVCLAIAQLSVVFFFCALISQAQAVQGTLDAVENSTCEVLGWARDPTNPTPIQVSLYKDGDITSGTLVSTFVANLLRTDLPFSDQNHGFDQIFATSPLLADGKSHSLYAYGITATGTAGALNGNGKTIQCASIGTKTMANVMDYGATGNGMTDDSNAIQAAINDTLPGGTVYFPPGTYIVATSHGAGPEIGNASTNDCGLAPSTTEPVGLLVARPNVTLMGTGRDSILMLGPTAKMVIVHIAASGVTLNKLVFDGNGAKRVQIDPSTGLPYNWPCGLVVSGLIDGGPVTNVTFRDDEMRNAIEDGGGLGQSPNFTVDHVYVHNVGGYGINSAYMYAAGGSAISLSGGPNASVSDGVFANNTYGPTSGFGSVGVNMSYNVSIRNCSAGLILGTGPAFTPPPQPDSSFTVRENWVEQNGAACNGVGVQIEGSQNSSFSNNHVLDNLFEGVLFNDEGTPWPATLNWQLTNNAIENNMTDGIEVRGRSSGIALTGNLLENNGPSLASQVIIASTASASSVNANWQSTNTVSYSPESSSAPVPTIAGVVNAASEQSGAIAPGEILALFGSNMGPSALVSAAPNTDGRFERILAGTRVLFDGVPAAMIYTSAGQVSVIAPYYLYWKDNTSVQVEYNGIQSAPVTEQIQQSQPALFTLNASGKGAGAILNQDYSLNSAVNPASRGSVVLLYATGEGQTDPAGTDGLVANATLPQPRLPVTVTIGGVSASVLYAGAAPTLVAGVMQINVMVPTNAPTGTAVPVQIAAGGVKGPSGVTVALK